MRKALLASLLLGSLNAANAQVQVAGSLILEHRVQSGQKVIEGTLTLDNPSSSAAQAQITLSDVRSDPKLGAVYLKSGTLERSNTSWIKLPSSLVTVPAKGKLAVPYRIEVPLNALPGTHWGVLFVTPVAAPKAAAATGKSNSINLQQVTQYAVQVVVNLPGGQAHLKFQQPGLAKTAAGITLNVELANTGERLALPTTRAEIYDAQGKLVQKIAGRDRRVYPGLSVLETYQINGLKPGKYQVLVIADDKDNDVVGARYNITVE